MKLMKDGWFGVRQAASWILTAFTKDAKRMGHAAGWVLLMALAAMAMAQAVSTTTVQGTVFLANGQPGAGSVTISWPSFTTAAGQSVAADRMNVTIPADGFLSVSLAPNVGATPAGEYYTAIYHMSDGTTTTQYWVVPAAAQAALGQVQSQVMPAAQAVQAVTKSYVDQAIAELTQTSGLTASGGTLTGPLYLSGDPAQPMQAADKHYVDTQVATAVPLAGGNMTGALTTPAVNGVESPSAASGQTTLQAAMNAAGTNGAMTIPPTYAGTDTFTNPNGVRVTDLRMGGAQQTERSVKEFGAVCDGATDDTNALQAAINYANAHGVALTIPQGTCKTRTLNWHGESIGGLGKQVSALKGFPGQDVLASGPDATNMLSYTRLHDLTIYVDQSVDVSCTPAEGRAAAGSCQVNRPMEANSIFSRGGNGLTGTAGTGAGWSVGNCAIAMPATTGAGGNGLRVAEMENVEFAATGVDPMAQYAGAHSTHTCGMYLAQWPQWSEFRNIDMRGLNTGVAIPALPGTAPAGLNADSNRWQNVTIEATHAFTAAAGSNDVLDNVVALAGTSAATSEPPTGLVLDLAGTQQNPQQGWTVRNAVVLPAWSAVQPVLTVATAGGAVTAVALGSEHGLGWDPYGTSVPVAFSGLCTAQATAQVNANGAISNVAVTLGGAGCSAATTANLNAAGTWDTAAPVNLIGGQDMTFFAGNLLKGNGGYTVWNATSSASYGTQMDGGGGTLLGGGTYSAMVGSGPVGSAFQVDQFPGTNIGAKLQACVNAVNATYGGTCDARNFTGNLTWDENLTIATGNVAVLLPCATITTANQIVVAAGTRNVSLRGCALRGGTQASGSVGGTALAYTGTGAMVQVGDPTYATDTPGFHMDNVLINTTGATSAAAQGLVAYRTQEMDLESMYFLGNSNQTGMTLDGTGNYTGGTYLDTQFSGFGTAVNAIGHQVTNPATTDWMNASTFVRLHINCPTTSGTPMSGTYGINLQQGDGNTFTGGDVEGCSTALHLGPNAQNNTIVGLRNENSANQVVADAGSAYNNWITGGTMFNGKLTDNGTRNSFLDTFHRSFNGLNGDWYGSQQDATLTNHFRLGIGAGNERGLLNEIQTDYGYRWLYGFSDAAGGQQLYQLQDLLNNVYRLQIQQWNAGQSSTNNQTALNAAGTGNVCFNCSTNSGTGGVTFASGGAAPAAVATVDSTGNGQFVGNLQVGGTTQSAGSVTVRNSADAEAGFYLWPGATTSQKGTLTYKDWNGNSQWYLVKDTSNNWALNSAAGGLDSFKAYQSTNSGDTYLDASNSTGHIRLNYETGSGAETDIYSGSSTSLDAAFVAPNAIKFPGLAATSGDNCLQIDNSGYITNTGAPCGSGSGGGVNGTINSGSGGQIAYYMGSGTSLGGMNAVPLASGGTGATTASGALQNLLPGAATDGNNGVSLQGSLAAAQSIPATSPYADIRKYGAVIDNATDIGPAVQAALNACSNPFTARSGGARACVVLLPCGGGCYWGTQTSLSSINGGNVEVRLQGQLWMGNTLLVHPSVTLKGEAGGVAESFQNRGAAAQIIGANVMGTLGTAVTSTNSPVTFTPAFSSESISNFSTNSWITVEDDVSVATTGTVTSTPWGGSGYNVTATLQSYTRIAPGSIVNVTGCADPTYNVTGTPLIYADFGKELVGWAAPNLGSGTTTGCTITGPNQDTFESVAISGVSGSSLTATFMHTHSASALWGMVGVALAPGTGPYEMDYIAAGGAPGAAFTGDNVSQATLIGDGFVATMNETSIAAEMNAGLTTIRDSSFLSASDNYPNPCHSNCPASSYPSGALRFTYITSIPNQGGCGYCWLENNTFAGGVEIDNNQVAGAAVSVPNFYNNQFREVPSNGITIDNRYGGTNSFVLSDPVLEDNFLGFQNYDYVGCTDPAGYGNGELQITNPQTSVVPVPVNSYFKGQLSENNADGAMPVYGRSGIPVGTYEDGGAIRGEIRSEGSNLGPSVIPQATLATQTDQSAQCISSGTCTVSNVPGPDGATSAIEIAAVGSSGGLGPVTGGQAYISTYAGDWFIYGAWVRHGAGQTAADSCSGSNQSFNLVTGGTDTLSGARPLNFGMILSNDWWHPQVALATVTAGESAIHGIALQLWPGCGAGKGNQLYDWFWMQIPGPNNPSYKGVTIDEVERWRQELMHGYVPSGLTANGGVLAMSGAHKLYWGNDTNLYRGAAGVVQTDGAMNVANGYEVNGAALATANLADWTDTGVANGQVPMWNAAQAKWTPGTLPSSVNSINGTSGPFTFTGAGVSCTGTTCTVAGTTASGNVQAGSQYSPAFYNQSGSSTTVGGVTPFTGLGYWQTSAPPAAATAAQIVSAIGTTAVANATNATNATNAATATSATTAASFSGSLAGDVTGTQSATTVSKVNGGAVPVSATVMGTNSSGQPVAATTTGSGSVVLGTSPTLITPTMSGATLSGVATMQGNVALQNGANSSQTRRLFT